MKRLLLCILVIGFCRVMRATPEDQTDTKIFLDSTENAEDTKRITVTEWYISPEELEQLPVSDPSAENPPLSVKDATALVLAEMQKNVEKTATWNLVSIELLQIDRGNRGRTAQAGWADQKTGKWFFKVTFSVQRSDPRTKLYTYPYPVYVLMDGAIAQRRVRPQTSEEAREEKQASDDFTDAARKSAKEKTR